MQLIIMHLIKSVRLFTVTRLSVQHHLSDVFKSGSYLIIKDQLESKSKNKIFLEFFGLTVISVYHQGHCHHLPTNTFV